MASTQCWRCHRALKNSVSQEHCYGPVCWAKVQRAVEQQEQDTNDVYDLPFDDEAMDIVCRRDRAGVDGERGKCHFNIPQAIVKHSQTGMEWGYLGSGPSDFALNILARFIGPDAAEHNGLYHEFKRDFVCSLPEAGGTIRGADIRAWLAAHAEQVAEAAHAVPLHADQMAWC